jgi:apolipoprotein N-acyltransferase
VPERNPVVRYMLVGAGMAAALLLVAGALVWSTYLSGKASGDVSGANGVIGFMIVPVVALIGAPWSLIAIRNSESTHLIMAVVIAGPVINGAIIGAALGYLANLRKHRAGRERGAA